MKQPRKAAAKRKAVKKRTPDTVKTTTSEPADATLGENIHQTRKRKGMTQLELAHAIGYEGDDAGAYISRVESGRQAPRLDTLQRIAAALGVTVCSLLPG